MTGNIAVTGHSDITQTAIAHVLTQGGGGTISVSAETGSIIMTDGAKAGTALGAVSYIARENVNVSLLSSSTGCPTQTQPAQELLKRPQASLLLPAIVTRPSE